MSVRVIKSTARQTLDNAISEREFMAQIMELARLYGWRVSHPWLSIKSASGVPDLLLVRVSDGIGRLIFIEVKTEKGKITSEQQEWLDLLGSVPGVRALCARPSDWQKLVDCFNG